ncbi:MAG: 30S ribosomal protein S6 [Deltaproteobacteria bacterium]|nr:30S ribosomal protein S6 [Deltaproteobacteria bacterium]
MRRYETVVIFDPELSDEERLPLFKRIEDTISQLGGFLVVFDEWGLKKLAYEIKKKIRGYYVRIDFCGTGTIVDEMERFFRIDDRVLKFMTVLLVQNVDVETLKEEIAKEKIEAERAAQSTESDSDQSPSEASDSETESQIIEIENQEEE